MPEHANESSLGKSVILAFLVAASYFITGLLSLQLAIPPGYASAFWPPSGIALAMTIIYGRVSLIGVYFGAVFVVFSNVGTFDPETWTQAKISMALVFGFGAVIQAAISSVLVRRFIGDRHALEETRSVFLFLTLGGPLACLISPSWGLTVLYQFGFLSWENIPMSYWHWWIGDTIGVVMFTPLLFVAFGRPRATWQARWAIVGWPSMVIILVLILSFSLARKVDQDRFRYQFYQEAKDVFSKIEGSWERDINTMEALQAFMDIDAEPGSAAFYQFGGTLLENNRSIQGLAWAPQVRFKDLDSFLTKARQDLPDFALKESAKGGFLPRPTNAEIYFPLRFVTTRKSRNRAAGLDLAAHFQLRKSLIESRDSGQIKFAAPVAILPENTKRGTVLLVALPVYHGNGTPKSSEARRHQFRGFVIGLFRMNRVLAEVVSKEARDQFEIVIFGQGDDLGETVAFKNLIEEVQDIPWESTLKIGSRAWVARIRPSANYWQKNSAYVSRFVLFGALMSGFFLNAFLLIFAGRNSRVERLVQERTVELSQSNLFLDSLVDTIPDAIIARDAATGQFALLNKAAEIFLGRTQIQLSGKTMADVLPTSEASRNLRQDRLMLAEMKLLDIAEEPYQSPEGERFARTRKAPIFGPDGQVRYLLSISTDITKDREIRAVLEKSKERYAALVELAPDAFVIVNSLGVVLIVNTKAEELFGYKRSEIVGQDVSKLFPKDEVKKSRWLLDENAGSAPHEVQGRHKDSSLLPLELTIGSIDNVDERLIVGAFRDTRVRRKAEIAVAQLQEIHHRVKNNLQIVHSLLRLQSRQVKDPKLESLLSESGSRIQAMALIHEQLYQSETVDRIQFADFLKSLKEKLVQAYARQAKNLTVLVEDDIEPWLPIDRCVPAGLIVHELVLNSFLHAFPDDRPGEITIKLTVIDQAEIEIEVSDDGIGFPEDKDFRTSDSLGLQLVNDLVDQLKGEIDLVVDGGSQFRARFPINPNRKST